MVGSAGPTIVWSRAPRNSPSMTAKRTSSFARWLRPSAGSSSSVGTYSPRSAGNDSIEAPSSCKSRDGRPAGGRNSVVDVVRVAVVPELDDECFAQVLDRAAHPSQLGAIEPAEDGPDLVVLQRLDLLADAVAAGRGADEHDPPVLRDADTLDESALLHPVDEAGRVAERDIQEIGEPAHRDVPVMLEKPQNVEVGHADAGLDHAAGAR